MSVRVSTVAEASASTLFAPSTESQTVILGRGLITTFDRKSGKDPAAADKNRPPPRPGVAATAEKVLRSFNTWAFKREQPSDPQLMLQFIAEAIALDDPIRFVLYWGKGPRSEVAQPDQQCLDFLVALASRIRDVHAAGAAIKLILTDSHAALNGHAPHDINCYFHGIEALAAQRGMEVCRLGALTKAAGDLATAAPIEDIVPAAMLSNLVTSARKWYRGGDTVEQGALRYLRMNLIEQRVVERAFPRAIFITFNGSDLRSLFPRQLPIFYMYSLRRGFGVKPWFLSATGAPINLAGEADGARLDGV